MKLNQATDDLLFLFEQGWNIDSKKQINVDIEPYFTLRISKDVARAHVTYFKEILVQITFIPANTWGNVVFVCGLNTLLVFSNDLSNWEKWTADMSFDLNDPEHLSFLALTKQLIGSQCSITHKNTGQLL